MVVFIPSHSTLEIVYFLFASNDFRPMENAMRQALFWKRLGHQWVNPYGDSYILGIPFKT